MTTLDDSIASASRHLVLTDIRYHEYLDVAERLAAAGKSTNYIDYLARDCASQLERHEKWLAGLLDIRTRRLRPLVHL